MRYWWIGFVGMMAACSGQASPGPVLPNSTGSPLTGTAGGTTSLSTVLDSLGIPDSSVGDTALLVADLNDERRQAADSAADEAVLEELADAHPEDPANDAGGDDEADAAPGGANAADAVTWDIDVATYNSHDRVQYYLDFFQSRGRERMNIWLSRLPRYETMIRERLQREGLPGDLVYLALIESGFSNTATSRAKAVGMWQFMKRTGKGYGLRVDSWVDERRDPYKATDAAAKHLADLNRRFGSLYLAAAAYNAGSGKVSRGIIRLPDEESDSVNSDATFFRLYDTKLLRRETKDYVPKLIAAALIAKQPKRYGFRVTPAEPAAYDSIVVPDMTGLDVIARLADTTVAAIRELNPQYLRLTTPPGTASVIRLPPGRGEGTVAAYAVLPARQRVTFIEHFMARGETLGHIARRYHVNQSMLLAANTAASQDLAATGRIPSDYKGSVTINEESLVTNFEDRWSGVERIPALDYSRLRQALEAEEELVPVEEQFVPGLTVVPDVKDRHAEIDVGGRLDTTREWRLSIPDPQQLSAGYRSAVSGQGDSDTSVSGANIAGDPHPDSASER